STWDDYYTDTILGNDYLQHKSKLVKDYINQLNFKTVIDLGANDGYFSMLLQEKASNIISVDFDSNCVNELYKFTRKNNIKNIVSIVATLNTPSPAIGWANEERTSLTERLKADLVLALALVHHLAISNNVPLPKIADLFSKMGTYLIIEFVPKSDVKVKQLLLHREDIFFDYNIHNFKSSFGAYYNFIKEQKVRGTERILFLMKRKIQ
ncbi:MAG: class I SAM-dependent methyltransferase, partial [Ferruginibacter sp.]|nr:class I SAM-dependent methyltransferase [Ferruginibacter sp.]